MLHFIIAVVVTFAAGFGAGRIKNKAKLAAVTAGVEAVSTAAVVEAKKL